MSGVVDPKSVSREELEQAYMTQKDLDGMKDAFVALVSHELRTPLSIIQGYLHLIKEMLRRQDDPESLDEYIGIVMEAGDSLEKAIVDLTTLSSLNNALSPRRPQEVNLPALLELLIEKRKTRAREREIELKLTCRDEPYPIFAEQTKLAEALGHMIDNALDFTPNGGLVELVYRDLGAEVEVCVVDTGVGIPEDRIHLIFTPFFQVQDYLTREVTGLGLGLAIARHIIADHGGTIKVESTLGQGTTFTVTLPKSYRRAEDLLDEFARRMNAMNGERPHPIVGTEGELMRVAQELSNAYAAEYQKNRDLIHSLEDMERTYLKIITIMVEALGGREQYTGGHTDRVVYFANCIARHYNPALLSDSLFKYSLLLYDIGKIGVGEDILKKAGALTEEEWEEMKTHTEIGASLLSSIPALNQAIDAVRSHHERWDGKGYPQGLKMEEIPVAARVISLAEAFDAMISKRPYRQAIEPTQAVEEIHKLSGVQFDPRMVEAFDQAWEEIQKRIQENQPQPVKG